MRSLRILTVTLLMTIIGCSMPYRPPNVIIVHVDDLGWADLGAYGSQYYETPNIDRLAAQGKRFTNAYAAAAICSPSRAAMMTGRYPARTGITDWIRASFQGDSWKPGDSIQDFVTFPSRSLETPRNQPFLPHEEITMAEQLKKADYVTAHIGKWHLGLADWAPETQGFDFNYGGCDFGQPPSYFDPYENERVQGIPTLPPRKPGEYLTDREADEARAFIDAHRERKFFLYYAPYAVHTPIQAKPEVEERYARKPRTNQDNPAYAAMIESVDDAVGRIVEALEEHHLADRTLILFTSDNGGLEPITDNAPLRDGKGSPFEGGIRVPLIAWWPGVIEPGTESEFPVLTIDYLPTVSEIAGVPVDHSVDGVSFNSILWNRGAPDREDLFWHFPHYRYNQVGPYSIVRSGSWKLIRYYDPEPYGISRYALFNLAADLGEETDLSVNNSGKVEELEEKLDSWLESVGARVPRPSPGSY
jgi:arylsulfatase A-like enzyme